MLNKILFFILISTIAVGCATKEEEAQTNISRVWKIQAAFQDEQDITSVYLQDKQEYTIEFKGGGDFVEMYLAPNGTNFLTIAGTWVFSDGIGKIRLTDSNQSRSFSVDELDENTLNLTSLSSTNGVELHHVPK